MSAVTSKVLFFTADDVMSAAEAAQVARLETIYRDVQVRNGAATAAEQRFSGALESFAYLAGTVPSAYSTGNEGLVLTTPSPVNPDHFKVFPATLGIDASNADVQQLAAVKAVIDPATGLATMTDLAAHASVVWTNSDDTKATVGADGLVTAVAAGSTTVTATLTAGTAVSAGAIEADTDVYTKAANGFITGQKLRLVSLSGGTGLSAGTDYFYRRLTVDTGYLCATLADAVAETPVPVNVTVDATSVVLVDTPVTSTCVVTVAA